MTMSRPGQHTLADGHPPENCIDCQVLASERQLSRWEGAALVLYSELRQAFVLEAGLAPMLVAGTGVQGAELTLLLRALSQAHDAHLAIQAELMQRKIERQGQDNG